MFVKLKVPKLVTMLRVTGAFVELSSNVIGPVLKTNWLLSALANATVALRRVTVILSC